MVAPIVWSRGENHLLVLVVVDKVDNSSLQSLLVSLHCGKLCRPESFRGCVYAGGIVRNGVLQILELVIEFTQFETEFCEAFAIATSRNLRLILAKLANVFASITHDFFLCISMRLLFVNVALRVRKYRGVVYGKMCTPIGLLEGFPDSDRAEAKRHNNTHSGEACNPLEPDS